jgi:hypothetical protein
MTKFETPGGVKIRLNIDEIARYQNMTKNAGHCLMQFVGGSTLDVLHTAEQIDDMVVGPVPMPYNPLKAHV